MNKFSERLFYRTLRVNILTLFLSLFIISFTFVIFFTHLKHTKAIQEFSLGTVERASNIILERVKAIIADANRFPIITDSIIWDESDITDSNEDLVLFLLRIIQFENNFSHIFAASQSGNYISANDLRLSSQNTYMTQPSKALPQNVRFSIFFVDASVEPHKNIWYYYDENLQLICHEESFGNEYDPRNRPWYTGASLTQGIYWSNDFIYLATGDKGISVSQPLVDKEGRVIGVTGVELSFVLLSQFLSNQHIGETGQAFLLHGNGKELVTQKNSKALHVAISRDTVNKAYERYVTTHQNSFDFENQGIKYLAYVDNVPVVTGRHWLIMIIVPLSDFFGHITETEKLISLITFGVMIIAAIFVFFFSKRISQPIVALSKEVDKMKHLNLTSELRVKSSIKEIMLIDASIAAMRNGLRSFARYVPKRIVKQLIEKGEEITLGGEKKEITVLFTDIAGFTSFSESHSTDEAMFFLSEYFDALSKIIITEEGIIDKYIGDSIMAFWGAPLEIKDHAIKACSAALRCQAFLKSFNQKRKAEGKEELQTRIAINTGTVIVGNIGTFERMNYTVIGDTVNTAAHLQPTNKIYHSKTLVTEETLKQTENRFLVRPLDIISLAGKRTKIKIYELIAFLEPADRDIAATEEQRELCDLFTRAFDAFTAKDTQTAKKVFLMIREKFPEDFPTQIYLERIEKGQ